MSEHKHKKTEPAQAKPESQPAAAQSPESAGTSSAVPQAPAEPSPEAKQAEELLKLQAEIQDIKNRYLRTAAELDNYRKRVQREMEDERRYRHVPLLRDLLVVLDNVERAVASAEQTRDPDNLLQGFKMVQQQLHRLLEQYHCQRIAAQGTPFDPRLHEAIMQLPSADQPPNTVIQEARSGFQLHDRVVRPSQVVVSTKPVGTEAPPKSEETADA